MACFSLHPRKIITTGDGGVITTNDDAFAARLKVLRQHAMSVPDTVRHGANKVIIEEYNEVGYNYRMTDVQAAIGIEQVKRLDGIVSERRRLAEQYTKALEGHSWLRAPVEPDWAESNFQSYAVQLTQDAPVSRNDLMQKLLDCGIATRRGIMLAHREKPFHTNASGKRLPISEQASDHSILLPLYPGLTPAEQEWILESLAGLKVAEVR